MWMVGWVDIQRGCIPSIGPHLPLIQQLTMTTHRQVCHIVVRIKNIDGGRHLYRLEGRDVCTLRGYRGMYFVGQSVTLCTQGAVYTCWS